MKILLTGASGFIGRHIGSVLTAAGHEVVAGSRSAGMDFNQLTRPADWQAYLQGVDVVINSVGIITERPGQSFSTLHYQAPVALFRACVEVGVKRVIHISALGADERAITPYQFTKKAADDVLRSLPLDWFVLRPSLVYGEGGKSAALFHRMASLPVIPVIAQGEQLIQPVHIDDLVETVMKCAITEQAGLTIDVVGPKAMTFAAWLQQLRLKSGKAVTTTLSMPFRVAMFVAPLLRYVMPLLSIDNLRMLEQGNTADVQPLVDFLGRMPRDIP